VLVNEIPVIEVAGECRPRCALRARVGPCDGSCEEGALYCVGGQDQLLLIVPFLPPIGHVAVCDGGSGALGHPVEYIQLDTVSKKPAVCKYCGLRFKMSSEPHHH
jgi:uncharacterized Zn-finger protein